MLKFNLSPPLSQRPNKVLAKVVNQRADLRIKMPIQFVNSIHDSDIDK